MFNSQRHHYIPEFFIRRWAGEDGQVWSYTRPYKALDRKRKFPSATGFEFDLYALSGGDPEARHSIETDFMQRVDSRAAQALQEVVAKRGAVEDVRLRSDWSRFVMSLISRSPSRVQEISRVAQARDHRGDVASLEARYQAMRGDDWPATVAEYVTQIRDDGFDQDLGRLVVRRLSDSPRIGGALTSLHWAVRDLTPEAPKLLLSDAPVSYSRLEHLDAVLVMPISPTQAFVAAGTVELLKRLLAIPEPAFIETLNHKLVLAARSIVIASDRVQEAMINDEFLAPKAPIRGHEETADAATGSASSDAMSKG